MYKHNTQRDIFIIDTLIDKTVYSKGVECIDKMHAVQIQIKCNQ